VPLGLAARQDGVVAEQLLAVECADEILADHDLRVSHLLFPLGGPIVLTGALDLLDPRQEVGPARDVAARPRAQADVHRVSVAGVVPVRRLLCARAASGSAGADDGSDRGAVDLLSMVDALAVRPEPLGSEVRMPAQDTGRPSRNERPSDRPD
jgi:hypothetical protein